MAQKAAYKDDSVKVKLLWALRSGQNLKDAAATIDKPLGTVEGWIRKDDDLAREVEQALEEGTVARTTNPVVRDKQTGADRWRKMREDAAAFAPGMHGFLLAVDARLSARKGSHALSPYHRWMLSEWYRSGKPVLLACEGRGAGKSDMQTCVVVTECVFAPRVIPPGETWIWPYASKDMNETNLKFGPLESSLNAIGLGVGDLKIHRRKDGRSEVGFQDASGGAIEVRCYPNTKDALRGPTVCGGTNDEEGFWRADKDLGTSSADDYLDAMAGAFRGDATTKKLMRISSANTKETTLMKDIETGDTDLHFVARLGPFVAEAVAGFELVASRLFAEGLTDDARTIRQWAMGLSELSPWIPSWIGNPTHDVWGGFLRLRKRVSKWLRENGSKPGDGAEEGDYFEPQTIDRAVATVRVNGIPHAARTQPNLRPSWDGHVRFRDTGHIWKQDTNNPVPDGADKLLFPQQHEPRIIGAPERFAAIDTGAVKNPSALCIVERVVHIVNGKRRYQFRPVLIKQWSRAKGGLPLDLRNKVLPEMARLILENKCVPRWWTDGWAVDQIQLVGAAFGIDTKFVSTSTATKDIYEPLDAALAHEPCPIVLSGCEGIEEAVSQLRQLRRGSDGKAIEPHVGVEHSEGAQVLARALAHAGVGSLPPDESASKFIAIPHRYSDIGRSSGRAYK